MRDKYTGQRYTNTHTWRHSAGSSRVGTRPNTLEILCTELNAVPHAGLGFHFLRVHVRTTGSWRSSRGSRAQKEENERRTNRLTAIRSHLQFKENIKTLKHRGSWLSLLPFRKRKIAGTSSWPSWISHFTGSFVGHSPSEMLCPPAVKQMQKHPYDSKGDTHTPPRRGGISALERPSA